MMNCMRWINQRQGRARLAWAAVVAASLACGDDATGPADATLVGAWSYHAEGNFGSTTCDVSGLVLTFTDQAGTLGGGVAATAPGNLDCGGAVADFNATPPIENITQNGDNVSFTWETGAGVTTVSGSFDDDDSMSGDVTFHLKSTSGNIEINGTWTASRT